MIVDSSAIVAVLLQQPGYKPVLEHLEAGPPPAVGGPTLVETGIVLTARLALRGKSLLGRFVTETGMRVLPFTDEHWTVAVDAYVRYGKGRHPAALNFGDCLTYATCRIAGEQLLCLGDDFPRTDLELVR